MIHALLLLMLLFAAPAWADVLTGTMLADFSSDPGGGFAEAIGFMMLGDDPISLGSSITDQGVVYPLGVFCVFPPCATMSLFVRPIIQNTIVLTDRGEVEYSGPVTASGEVVLPTGNVISIEGTGTFVQDVRLGFPQEDNSWRGVFTDPATIQSPELTTGLLLLTGLLGLSLYKVHRRSPPP